MLSSFKVKHSQKYHRGAALVEYALLVALIAVVCITALQTIGTTANKKLEQVAKDIAKF